MNGPPRLYKYRSLSEGSFQHTCDILIQRQVYFTKPSELNDPFECRFSLAFEATAQEKRDYFERQPVAPGVPRFVPKDEMALREWEESRPEAFGRFLQEEVRMFCLSERNDDILMWSHYADNHRGICVEFYPTDPKRHFPFFLPRQVRYQSGFPTINVYRTDSVEKVHRSILTKSDHWAYEKEWRVIVDIGDRRGVQVFPEGLVTGIVMGCCISGEHRRLVLKLAAEHGSPVSVYEVRRLPDSYALEAARVQ